MNTTEFERTPAPRHTPWGTAQSTLELMPGIWAVSTASHGGLKLSTARYLALPAALRANPYGGETWFEEDLDAVFPLYYWGQDRDAYFPSALKALSSLPVTLASCLQSVVGYTEIYGRAVAYMLRHSLKDVLTLGGSDPTQSLDPFATGDQRRRDGIMLGLLWGNYVPARHEEFCARHRTVLVETGILVADPDQAIAEVMG